MEEYSDRTPVDIVRLPMVPIRDVVIFPFTKVAFKIGRPARAPPLEAPLATDRTIFLATQHDASIDEPSPDQIYTVGTVARILQAQRQENGQTKVVVEGGERATTLRVEHNNSAVTAHRRRPATQTPRTSPPPWPRSSKSPSRTSRACSKSSPRTEGCRASSSCSKSR